MQSLQFVGIHRLLTKLGPFCNANSWSLRFGFWGLESSKIEKTTDYLSNTFDFMQVVMRDRHSGRPRGFGFVTYKDPGAADIVVQEKHVIDGREVRIF